VDGVAIRHRWNPELFVNVPAYGIAYSSAPTNMRGLVSALNLLNTAIAYAIGLACSSIITDPYLTWDFGGPAVAGGILTVVFCLVFRHIDKSTSSATRAVTQTTDWK
jgi:dipeptide/tripeptide permease